MTNMSILEPIAEQIRLHLSEKYSARERALQLSREAIRHSANAIRAVHRDEFERARELLALARGALQQIRLALEGHPDVFYAGFVQDADKEYVEAAVTLALVAGQPLPDPESLAVAPVSYLHGLGEAVGELRRYLLDRLRRGDVSPCEDLLTYMDDIYTILVTMDFPDGMTGVLRRTTDIARGILEKTRGDLTMALRQRDLEATLREFEERIKL